MKYFLHSLILLSFLGSLTLSVLPSPVKPESQNPNIMQIQQTTVAEIDGIRVVVGNIAWQGEYTLPDGTKRQGHTARLGILGQWYTVGQGSIITVGQSQWKVMEIEHGGDNLGSVTLQKINP